MVSTISWSPDGQYLAVGVCDRHHIYDGQVTIWSKAGSLTTVLPLGHDAILCLRWSRTGNVLLGVCASLTCSDIMLWDPSTADPLGHIQSDAPLEDAAWVNDDSFLVAGGTTLRRYRSDLGHAEVVQTYQTPDQSDLWMVKYDSVAELALTCSHGTSVDIWDRNAHLHTLDVHHDQITALEWQPLKHGKSHSSEPRLFATASLDGFVRVFSSQSPYPVVHTLTFNKPSLAVGESTDNDEQVMAMTFSPDGTYIAAVNAFGLILIWNVHEGGLPKASWWGGSQKSFQDAVAHSNGNGNGLKSENGDDDGGDHHNLSWSGDGSRLAYCLNRQVGCSSSILPTFSF
jgi:WD40 repeat protein